MHSLTINLLKLKIQRFYEINCSNMILCRQDNFIALYGTSYSIQSNINYFIRIFLYFYAKKDERFPKFFHPFSSINFFYCCASSAAFFAFSSATVRYFIVSVLISSFNSSVNCSSFTLHSQLPPTVDGVLILASLPNPR